jgi:hypothetical protein
VVPLLATETASQPIHPHPGNRRRPPSGWRPSTGRARWRCSRWAFDGAGPLHGHHTHLLNTSQPTNAHASHTCITCTTPTHPPVTQTVRRYDEDAFLSVRFLGADVTGLLTFGLLVAGGYYAWSNDLVGRLTGRSGFGRKGKWVFDRSLGGKKVSGWMIGPVVVSGLCCGLSCQQFTFLANRTHSNAPLQSLPIGKQRCGSPSLSPPATAPCPPTCQTRTLTPSRRWRPTRSAAAVAAARARRWRRRSTSRRPGESVGWFEGHVVGRF